MTAETPRTAASKRVHSRYHDPRTPHFPRETYCVDYDDAVRLERDLTAAREQIAKLAAFKAFVHEFLDRNGVPTDPPGKMRDEGCRVGQRLKYLVDERDSARERVAKLEAGLLRITDHFAAVMGGSLVTGRGIEFENGVEGIPTIANARALLAPSPEPKP